MALSAFLTRHCFLSETPPDDDPQVIAVYNLDREMLGAVVNTHCPKKHLESVVKHACKKWTVPVPVLKLVRRDNRTFGECGEDAIELNKNYHGDNMVVLLHELAHWITDRLTEGGKKTIANHSPEFAGVYMALLDTYKVIPDYCFRAIARRHGVRISRRFPLYPPP